MLIYEKEIRLRTKKEMDIFTSATRQQLLRLLTCSPDPMTPKALSIKMGISPSSVQHHIRLLESLGLVELAKTQQVNGITAKYYTTTGATVSLGISDNQDPAHNQKKAMGLQLLQNAIDGFSHNVWDAPTLPGEPENQNGDLLCGVAFLTPDQWQELCRVVTGYLESHKQPCEGAVPWEYALLAYRREKEIKG